jgi:hypothetical protein
MVFSDLWAGRAVKTTLAPKFWRPCPKMGQGWPWKGRGRVESWAPLPPTYPPPSLFPPFFLPPKAKGKRGRRGRGGGKWGRRGCMGWVHVPPPPLAAAPRPREILVFSCEFFLYIKLKWSSLGSLLGFSFCENLRMLKKSKNGNTNANVLYPRRYKKCFHYATLVSYL